MSLDPHRLLILRAVWRTGSMQEAATALHLTPSGVSQHLARLEAETGLSLIDRTRRGGGRAVRLTTAGLALAERADDVALALAETEREAEQLRDASAATVRIGGFATALGRLVVPAIARAGIADSGLEVNIVETDASEGLRLLHADELDLLISDRPLPTGRRSGIESRELLRDAYRIVVPSAWATRPLEEIVRGAWVAASPDQPSRHLLDRLFATRHIRTPRIEHLCTESRTMLALVSSGLGAALVPELTLAFQTTAGIDVVAAAEDVGSRVLTVLNRRPASYAVDRFRTMLVRTAGGR
ncbi:LysR family transcriptional regulator [Pseudonocardia phyllosphaerae]|uniref:LysR family transcriptional regulator n=1 Tax=Pseudonocardia phyllosphaerae TaxID=3390502 RepID=UPI00397C0FFD